MSKTLSLPVDLSVLDTLHGELHGFLGAHGAAEDFVEEMFLVAEELVVNTISYGYEGEDVSTRRIQVDLLVVDGTLRMTFTDDALAYNPLDAEEPDLDAPMAERRIGGLGVHLVRKLTDSVSYAREQNQNILIVERKVS